MEHEQLLKLNPETGYYETTFTIRIEAEIFRRVLFNYVEEHHIDPTDLPAWEKAVNEVARAGKWLSHPRAVVTSIRQPPEEPAKESKESLVNNLQETQNKPTLTFSFLPGDERALWEKAMQLPVDEWESLLTPLPDELGSQDPKKRPYYMRRYAERRSLERLKEQLEPTSAERMEAIAQAVNDARLK